MSKEQNSIASAYRKVWAMYCVYRSPSATLRTEKEFLQEQHNGSFQEDDCNYYSFNGIILENKREYKPAYQYLYPIFVNGKIEYRRLIQENNTLFYLQFDKDEEKIFFTLKTVGADMVGQQNDEYDEYVGYNDDIIQINEQDDKFMAVVPVDEAANDLLIEYARKGIRLLGYESLEMTSYWQLINKLWRDKNIDRAHIQEERISQCTLIHIHNKSGERAIKSSQPIIIIETFEDKPASIRQVLNQTYREDIADLAEDFIYPDDMRPL